MLVQGTTGNEFQFHKGTIKTDGFGLSVPDLY